MHQIQFQMSFRRFLPVLFVLLGAQFATAQIDSSQVNASPYGAVYNHLYYLQPDSYQPDLAARSLPPGTFNGEALAEQLKQILDGKGYYIDVNRLPTQLNYVDSLSGEAIYFVDRNEQRIYLERIQGRWYYSKTTIQQIPALFREVFPFGTGFFKFLSGSFWDAKLGGLALSKWAGLLMLLFLTAVTYWLINGIAIRLIQSVLQRRLGIPEAVRPNLRRMARLLGLLLAVRLFLFFLPMLQIPAQFNATLILIASILGIFFLILLIVQIVGIGFHYFQSFAKSTESTLDDQLLPVLRRIVNIIVWTIGLIYILDYLHVDVTALIAGISIGGLALALAAQDTLKNFFGSIMIFLDRPFQVGDWIHFDDVDGTVEEVGVRSTRIRTFANSVVYVPNGILADKVLNNLGLRQYRRFKTEITITYDTPPETIDLFVKGIRAIVERHPTTRKDYFEVHLNSFGASSLNVLLYCFFKADSWTKELEGRHEIMYAVISLAADLGVKFAFPSQSIYVESMHQELASPKKTGAAQLQQSLDKISGYFATEKQQNGVKQEPLGGE